VSHFSDYFNESGDGDRGFLFLIGQKYHIKPFLPASEAARLIDRASDGPRAHCAIIEELSVVLACCRSAGSRGRGAGRKVKRPVKKLRSSEEGRRDALAGKSWVIAIPAVTP
jgi:hypothetical protein